MGRGPGTNRLDFGGDPVYEPFLDPDSDREHCDEHTTADSWARPRGAQLTAGYTVNTYSIIHSALARLAWRAYARRSCAGSTTHILGPGGPLPHAKNEVDRTTRSGDMAKPSADRLTRDTRQTDTSYRQPTNQPTSQPFCQYPAVSWELGHPVVVLLNNITSHPLVRLVVLLQRALRVLYEVPQKSLFHYSGFALLTTMT